MGQPLAIFKVGMRYGAPTISAYRRGKEGTWTNRSTSSSCRAW
jgi:hypothetical protein